MEPVEVETVEWRLRSECAIGERRTLLVMNDRRRTAGLKQSCLRAPVSKSKAIYL